MDIKIGEYARLNSTLYNTVVILKIMEVFDNTIVTENNGSIFQGEYGKDEIINHSYNIIDLIEENDFINSMRIAEIKSNKNGVLKCMVDSDYEFITTILNDEIKSVVTKEQFSFMQYEVN